MTELSCQAVVGFRLTICTQTKDADANTKENTVHSIKALVPTFPAVSLATETEKHFPAALHARTFDAVRAGAIALLAFGISIRVHVAASKIISSTLSTETAVRFHGPSEAAREQNSSACLGPISK